MYAVRNSLRHLAWPSSRGRAPAWASLAFSRRICLEVQAAQRTVRRSLAPGTPLAAQHSLLLRSFSSAASTSSGGGGGGPKNDNEDDNQKRRKIALALLLQLSLFSYIMYRLLGSNDSNGDRSSHSKQIPRFDLSWNEFYHDMLAKGEVEQVIVFPQRNQALVKLYPGAIVKGHSRVPRIYVLTIANVDQFETRLREAERQLGVAPGSVPVVYDRQSEGHWFGTVFMLGIMLLIFFQMKKYMNVKTPDFFGSMRRVKYTVVDPSIETKGPKVRFADVAGCHSAKQEIREFIDYLQDPGKFKLLGAKMPKGVLLLGPPGCGKTMLAKAVATEAKVPFLAMAGSEFVEMIGGLGAARVRNLFTEARKRSPCIVYIDEIDALGRQRAGETSGGEEEQTLNQLLVEMDGMATREGVILLASTNREDILDKALLRPGRFDRHILIDLPNLAERVEIFDRYLAKLVLDQHPSRYSQRLAQLTPGFSGADIANVCNEAALHAARTLKRQVEASDIDYAIDRVLGGAERKTHAMSPEERKRMAVYWSGFAIVAWFLEQADKLLKVSIVARSKSVGTAQFNPSEKQNYTTEELLGKISVKLAGRAAEVVVYGQPSTGTAQELKTVTDMAKAIVEKYGMDDVIGPLSYSERKAYSKKLVNTLDYQASQLVQEAYNRALEVIRNNSEKLHQLAAELEKKETLHFKDIEAILGVRPVDQTVKASRNE